MGEVISKRKGFETDTIAERVHSLVNAKHIRIFYTNVGVI